MSRVLSCLLSSHHDMLQVLGRVDAYVRAGEFGYIEANKRNNKGVGLLAGKVRGEG